MNDWTLGGVYSEQYIKSSSNIAFRHFPPIFVLSKLTCLVTLFDRKLLVLKNSPKWTIFGIFNQLLSTQNVNIARFARNVEWDFFCDFQTPCSVTSNSWLFSIVFLKKCSENVWHERILLRSRVLRRWCSCITKGPFEGMKDGQLEEWIPAKLWEYPSAYCILDWFTEEFQ